MGATVLLLHEMPDGLRHYDWMLEREVLGGGDPDERSLVTFRLGEPFEAGIKVFAAERIGDHRRAYLTFEGSVPGGRGVVSRVSAGTCEILEETESWICVELELGELCGRIEGTRGDGGIWDFVVLSRG